jgi:hypothetical protein
VKVRILSRKSIIKAKLKGAKIEKIDESEVNVLDDGNILSNTGRSGTASL